MCWRRISWEVLWWCVLHVSSNVSRASPSVSCIMNSGNSTSSHCLCVFVSLCPSASGALCIWAEGSGSHAERSEPSLLPSPVPLHTLSSCTHLCWHCSQASLHGVCVFFLSFLLSLILSCSLLSHINKYNEGYIGVSCVFVPFRFPSDPNCQTIDQQFLWGNSLLISPVLEQGAVELAAYLPPGTWYSLHNVSLSMPFNFLCLIIQLAYTVWALSHRFPTKVQSIFGHHNCVVPW